MPTTPDATSRGRLKIFLGAAPGVGKTWKMLAEARRLRAEGVDVLGGIIETHGRAGTLAQLGELPMLAARETRDGGRTAQELDVDAALARRPAILLVDELAHSNAPGSRHAKRWEDVAELRAAGLDVWTTLNVQHLESLNDDIFRITGVRVRETLPDCVLEEADEVELIDLPPEILRERLRAGQIYRPDAAQRALDGYFREGTLTALREIALRRTAAHVDESLTDWMTANAVSGPWPAAERILALIGPDAAGEAVVRQAKQLADALHAPWLALHVEHAAEAPRRRVSLPLAARLGAETETRSGHDLLAVALDVAASRRITQIVVGQPQGAAMRRWRPGRRNLARALLRHAGPFAVHVVPTLPAPPRPRPRAATPDWRPWAAAAIALAAVTLLGLQLDRLIPQEAMGMIFLAVVVAAASLHGLRLALSAACAGFLLWDFFFIPPVHTITIANPHDLIGLIVFFAVASITGILAGRVRREARAGQARIDSLRRIGAFSRRLAIPASEKALIEEIAAQAAAIAGEAVVLTATPGDAGLRLAARAPTGPALDEGAEAAARWSGANGVETGSGTATLPSVGWRFLPMQTNDTVLGVVGIRSGDAASLPEPALQAASTLVGQATIALDRLRLAALAARATALEETQSLRTALLNSLSHDLRTPLTSIRGAAETLHHTASLDDATRGDLLGVIEDETTRITKFLANIVDLTRLESGQIRPRLAPLLLADAAEAAAARVPGAWATAISCPAGLSVLADETLLEQVLVNVLDNAVKFSSPGSPIALRARADGALARIEIADEGVGVAPAALPYLFDSFFRAQRGDRGPSGTGLGLAIARGMVEAMGGTISATSPRPDLPRDGAAGLTITLTLPLAA